MKKEIVNQFMHNVLSKLETEHLEQLNGIVDYNPGKTRRKYIFNIVGYINDEVVENQGYSWEDIIKEYQKILNPDISSWMKSSNMVYLFTHFIITEVMDGGKLKPTLEQMLSTYKN